MKPLEKRLRTKFAGIHLGTKVVEMKDAGDKVEVKLEGPETSGTFLYDRVLVSIGRRANTDGLGLDKIGFTIHQLDSVMDGKIQPLIEALITHYQAEKLKQEAAGVV